MSFSIVSITFLVGLALIVIGLLGGGIEVKEIKIPTLGIFPRVVSFATGFAILALCFFLRDIFPGVETERKTLSDKIHTATATPTPAPALAPAAAPTPTPVPAPTPTLTPALPAAPAPLPALPKASWYVMLGSFAASNGDAVSSAERVKKQATEDCLVSARAEPTVKMEGFTPGYVSSFLGPYDTQKDAAADKEKVLPCVPDAYIKSIRR